MELTLHFPGMMQLGMQGTNMKCQESAYEAFTISAQLFSTL
jgi:hypothetical protein